MSPQSKPAIQAASRQIDGPLLEVTDLSTHFRTARGLVRSVDGVSFTLQRGRSLGIVVDRARGAGGTVPHPAGYRAGRGSRGGRPPGGRAGNPVRGSRLGIRCAHTDS